MSQQNQPAPRLGFIGGFGHHYLAQAIGKGEIIAAGCAIAGDGRDADAARQRLGQMLPDATWFDGPIDMLDRFQPQVVSMGGIYAHNARLSIEALNRGIGVVSDKPVAATWDDHRALCSAAEGRKLITEFDFRGRSGFRAARQAYQQGRIGDVVLINAQKSYRFGNQRPDFYRRRADYGSTLLWVASHAIDAIAFVTGQTFTAVAAHHGNVARRDYLTMEDHCAAMFTLGNGSTAVVHADFHQPQASASHGDDRLRVVGSKGILEVRDERCLLTTHNQATIDITDEVTPVSGGALMLDAALHGENDAFGTKATLAISKVLLHARDAADSGKWVRIGSDKSEK
ncbi:MAG: Gfo/Idh/MocA family oxidoreductase [Phycisphaeraceae bacterium]|nr:Gfo/Idh/MocA family oxidoreductase [Phycisphaeraceae bacterium]